MVLSVSVPNQARGGAGHPSRQSVCTLSAFGPKQQTLTHTFMVVAVMQGADQYIRSSLGFSILPKDTSTCRPGESNQWPSDYKKLALRLSHRHPTAAYRCKYCNFLLPVGGVMTITVYWHVNVFRPGCSWHVWSLRQMDHITTLQQLLLDYKTCCVAMTILFNNNSSLLLFFHRKGGLRLEKTSQQLITQIL